MSGVTREELILECSGLMEIPSNVVNKCFSELSFTDMQMLTNFVRIIQTKPMYDPKVVEIKKCMEEMLSP
jgi:hypothetical protein